MVMVYCIVVPLIHIQQQISVRQRKKKNTRLSTEHIHFVSYSFSLVSSAASVVAMQVNSSRKPQSEQFMIENLFWM